MGVGVITEWYCPVYRCHDSVGCDADDSLGGGRQARDSCCYRWPVGRFGRYRTRLGLRVVFRLARGETLYRVRSS